MPVLPCNRCSEKNISYYDGTGFTFQDNPIAYHAGIIQDAATLPSTLNNPYDTRNGTIFTDPNLLGTNTNPSFSNFFSEPSTELPFDIMSPWTNDFLYAPESLTNPLAGPSTHPQGPDLSTFGPNLSQPFAPIPQHPMMPATPAVKYACTYPGCPKTYSRRPDMLRHALNHDVNAARLDCGFAGCRRTGARGFTRNDKKLEHERVHRRRANGRANGRG